MYYFKYKKFSWGIFTNINFNLFIFNSLYNYFYVKFVMILIQIGRAMNIIFILNEKINRMVIIDVRKI